MFVFHWIVGVLIGAVLLAALARRLRAPYPAFLALGGVGLAFVPGMPSLGLDPELALALFLAPVLMDAGYSTSLRDLVRNWRPIAGLAVGAVAATTAAVAAIALWLVPDMPLSAAIVLGAVVAPPDAVAALSVLAHVSLPHRLATILRGESLLNDAASLLIYRLGVAAAVTGHFSVAEVAPAFLIGVVGSLVAGPLAALVYLRILRRVEEPMSTIVLQFSAAFGLWIVAEAVELSGVLTVVSFAITVARRAPGQTTPRLRVVSNAVWETAIFVLNVLAFVLIGEQIGPILARMSPEQEFAYASVAAAVVAAVAASATLGARLDVDGDGFITQHDLVAFAQESHWGPHSAPIEMKRKIQINNTVYQATFARSTQDPSVLEAVSFEEVASHGLAAHAVTQESAKISSLN